MENQNPQIPPQNIPTEPPVAPQSPQPIESSGSSGLMKKLIIGAAVILVITAVGTGGYLLGANKNKPQTPTSQIIATPTPTPDPTANWKTYTNATYKYSLKIPNDWSIDYDGAKLNEDRLVFIDSSDYKEVGDTQAPHLSSGVMLQAQSSYTVRSYDDFIAFTKPDKRECPNEGKELTVDGEKAMLWISNCKYFPGQRGYQMSVVHKGQGYSLFMVSALSQDELFDQILSTFKFTGSASKNTGSASCIQVITPAKNNSTSECREFPTPCDVPEGWSKVSSCSN